MNILYRFRYLNMYCKSDPSFLFGFLICAPVFKMSLQVSVMGITITWWMIHWLSFVDKRGITTQCDHEKDYLPCPEHVRGPTILMPNGQLSFLFLCHNPPVASFTKDVNPRLAKRPLKTNGRLANHGLTSLVKEATGGKSVYSRTIRPAP